MDRVMNCQACRQALSAVIDDEDPGVADPISAHLDGCAACRRWHEQAVEVTRLVRVGLTLPSPGLPAWVLDVAPEPRRARTARKLWNAHGAKIALGLRIALGVIGAVQLLVSVAQIAAAAIASSPGDMSGTMGAMPAGSVDGASPYHLLHESAAWNIGVGAAFLLIAARFASPASVVAILTAFVATLTALSAGDLAAGAVTWGRIASHLLLVTGYVIVVLLSRPSMRRHEPPSGRARRWRLAYRS